MAYSGSHEEHGGIDFQEIARLGLDAETIVDFSVNSNPFGPAPEVAAACREVNIAGYPDRRSSVLIDLLAGYDQVKQENILVGNGTTELIWLIVEAFLKAEDMVLIIGPTFSEYRRAARLRTANIVSLHAQPPDFTPPLDEVLGTIRRFLPRMVFLCNPNNPTGQYIDQPEIESFRQSLPANCLLVLDEAYRAFVPEEFKPRTIHDNTILLRSMTKDFSLAGLRLGYVLARPALIEQMRSRQPTWSVNAMAQAAGCAALGRIGFYRETWKGLHAIKMDLFSNIESAGFRVLPSDVHFAMVRARRSARELREKLLRRSMLVRDCASFGLPEYIRVSTQLPAQNQKLIIALSELRAEYK